MQKSAKGRKNKTAGNNGQLRHAGSEVGAMAKLKLCIQI